MHHNRTQTRQTPHAAVPVSGRVRAHVCVNVLETCARMRVCVCACLRARAVTAVLRRHRLREVRHMVEANGRGSVEIQKSSSGVGSIKLERTRSGPANSYERKNSY